MELFGQKRLLLLQIANAVFVAADDGGVGGIEDAADNAFDFLVERCNLALAGADDLLGLFAPCLPRFSEHGGGQFKQRFGRLQALYDRAHFTLKRVARCGLAIGLAILGLAQIVGKASTMPSSGEG
ncbi:MAG: hypothetical protein AAF590_12850 [Pseudomonadota bacterium]